MQITLKLQNFCPDTDNNATIEAYYENELIGRVIIQFAAEEYNGNHRILQDFNYPIRLPHYAQARIMLRASEMVDSFFSDAPDVDPTTRAEVEV